MSDEDVELIQNNLGAIISDINKRRFSLLETKEYDKINVNKSLTMNPENEDFVPIDISNNNLNRYYDLVPCLINYYYEIYDFDDKDGEETEYKEEDNGDTNINNIDEEGIKYFTINATK